jgi:hypothetical protein
MLDAMTPADLGMILAGVAMAIIGALGVLNLLSIQAIIFIVLGVSAVYISFIAGIEYGNPRRA